MIRTLYLCCALALLTLLASCSSGGGRLVTAGSGIQVFDMQVDSKLDWARMRLPREEVWTIDGLPLNRFVVFSNVKPNEHVLLETRERKRRPDGPWYRPGMRPDEIRDVVLDALRANGWVNLQASNLRPAQFGGVEGLRFEATMTSSNGLIYQGLFGAVERKGKLTHFFWAAPREHYYGRDVEAVESMFASIRFVE